MALEQFDSTIFFTIPNILVLQAAFEKDQGLFRAQYSGIIKNNETREVFESLTIAVQQLSSKEKESIMNNLE